MIKMVTIDIWISFCWFNASIAGGWRYMRALVLPAREPVAPSIDRLAEAVRNARAQI